MSNVELPTIAHEIASSPSREVVAIVLCRGNRIGLFRRSDAVAHDRGLWHCITGYLDASTDAWAQALQELREEVDLREEDFDVVESGPILEIADTCGGLWRVHTFRVETRISRLNLNWEHDAYRWVSRRLLPGFSQVAWLRDVLDAVNNSLLDQNRPA